MKHEPAPYRRVRQQESWLSPFQHPPTPGTIYWVSTDNSLGHLNRFQARYTHSDEWQRVLSSGELAASRFEAHHDFRYLTLVVA